MRAQHDQLRSRARLSVAAKGNLPRIVGPVLQVHRTGPAQVSQEMNIAEKGRTGPATP